MWKLILFLATLAAIPAYSASSPLPSPSPSDLKYPIFTPLEGPKSVYTDLIVELIKQWPPRDIHYAPEAENPVQIHCLETPGNKYFIGAEQSMFVHAPLQGVVAILDDVDHYADLFPGFAEIKRRQTDGNQWLVYFEQRVPIPFVSNVKYLMTYLVDDSKPGRKIYRYQLKRSENLKVSDGVIVVESQGPSLTRYTEYDFFDADWGPAKVFAPGRIWGDSIEGLYLSDVATKLKAENPEWNYQQIRKTAENYLKKYPLDEELKRRKQFYLLTR